MYEDYLNLVYKKYLEEGGSDSYTVKIAQGRAKDPDYDIKENEAFKKSLKHIKISKEKF